MTRYYIDSEFNEAPGKLELISIGIIDENGREYYAVSSEFDEKDCNDWVKANVLPKLGIAPRKTKKQIAKEILTFIGNDTPQFWGYYADYDWVIFCWLFGAMIDLPKGWPKYCKDIKQLFDDVSKKKTVVDPPQEIEHNALADAKWNKKLHEHLMINI